MAGVCCSSIRWTSCAAWRPCVPPKGQNLVRYHGVFAPNSKHRGAVVRLVRGQRHTLSRWASGAAREMAPRRSASPGSGQRPSEPPLGPAPPDTLGRPPEARLRARLSLA